VLATSCLLPSGPIRQVHPNLNLADPAAVQTGSDSARVYATNTVLFWGAPTANVPSYSYMLSTGAVSNPTDALPNLPSWVRPNVADNVRFVWAPTVRFVGGRYLMMFTASRQSGWACIGAAHSTSAAGPFTPMSTQWCSSSGGLLDPQLFVDADGAVWVHYSLQNPNTASSQIIAQRISFNGSSLSTVGSASTILTVAQARSVCGLRHPVNACTVSPGATPAGHFVENPAMVRDPHNGYNLLVSLGNWRDNSYRTVEVPCSAPNSGCLPQHGAPIQESSATMNQLGGASPLRDDSPAGNKIFFHARRSDSTNRTTHIQDTVAIAGT
jgi:hypothetical protein